MSEFIALDMPSLQYIYLGYGALCGISDSDSCSLSLQGKDKSD